MNALKGAGRHFASSCDAEVILNRFAQEMIRSKNNIWKAARACMDKLDGSYSVVLMTGEGELVAFRDHLGIKPLCYAINNKRIVFASESTAIDINNMTVTGDVKPGEVFVVSRNKVRRRIVKKSGRRAHCMFEYVYFARQDSLIDGRLVYDVRFRLGETLARSFPVKADIVVAVPDTSKIAALGYSKVSGIPAVEALTKNRYVGRTFIMPDQSKRVSATFLKLNPLKSAIKGKKLVVIDDSIVRGTTIGPIVRMLRKAGAKEVHVRIACPPIISPCFYGIDIPTYKELAAYKHSLDEIRKMSGADSLEYISIGGMVNAIGKKGKLCLGCLMDSYPTPVGQRLADEVKNGRYTSAGRCWEKIG
jgi:amidophosphoribosyltransferase